MKKILLLMACFVQALHAQNFSAGIQLGDAGDDKAGGIATDAAGNVYTIGEFSGSVDFDPGPAVYTMTAQSASDVFINKYDIFGNLVWVKQMASTGGFNYKSLSVSSSGDVYAAVTFSGTVDFDPVLGAGTNTLTAPGIISTFICKLNTSGSLLWTKQFEGTGNKYTKHITSDAAHIYLTGFYAGPVDFNPGAGTYTLTTTASYYDIFVCKLDLNGNFVWAKNMGGADHDHGNSSAVDLAGNVYVSGTYSSVNCDFDPSAATHIVGGSGHDDGFVCKLDASGNYVWVNAMPALAVNSHLAEPLVICNKFNQVYISGYFFDQTMIGSTVLNAPWGSMDMYIARLTGTGNVMWAYNIGGTNDDLCKAVVSDTLGNVYLTGGFYSSAIDFNPGPGTATLSATGSSFDGFVMKMDSLGGFMWVKQYAGSNEEAGISLALDPDNNAYILGSFNDTINLNPAGAYKRVSKGGYDVFLSKLSCAPLAVSGPDTVCKGTSAVFVASGGNTYTWSIGASSPGITVMPANTTTISVIANDNTACSNMQTFYLVVDSLCQDVWPGDANSDGLVDNTDVLELGLHFTQTGPARSGTSNAWQSYFANNWAGTISNGKNLNHSDCNGDGTIDQNDTLAVFNNYGLTHAFKPAEPTAVNPQLSIVPDQGSLAKGSWGTASVFLGEALAPVTNINGLAFTVTFDQSLIDANSFYIEYPVSFINSGNQNLRFQKPDAANGRLYTATTHTNNTNVSGNGKIAVLHYKIKSTLAADQVLNIGITQAKQSNATGMLLPLTAGAATVAAIGASVGMDELSNGSSIGLYPNPANTSATIQSSSLIQKVELLSLTGQVIISEPASGTRHQLDLTSIANGVYFVKAYTVDQKVMRKKLVVQR